MNQEFDQSAHMRPRGDWVENRVSVIIPAFNYGRFIVQAVDSVFRQDHSDLEILVVDDGSTDNTQEVLRPYFNRIAYLQQTNLGVSEARNAALSQCTGEWVLFLDADDILGPGVVRSHLLFLQDNPSVTISVCRNFTFREISPAGYPAVSGQWPLPKTNLGVHLCHFNIAPPHAFFSHRRVIQDTGFFDSSVNRCEDYDYWLRAAVRGHIPHQCPEGFVYYRTHPSSGSANLEIQCQVDRVMHERLSNLLEAHKEFPVGHRVEGLLAHVSGSLVTVLRLIHFGLPGGDELLSTALRWIREIRDIGLRLPRQWNVLSQLFVWRTLRYLTFPTLRRLDTVCEINETLVDALRTAGLYRSKLGFLLNGLGSSIRGSGTDRLERKWIRNLTLSTIANPIDPLLRILEATKFR